MNKKSLVMAQRKPSLEVTRKECSKPEGEKRDEKTKFYLRKRPDLY